MLSDNIESHSQVGTPQSLNFHSTACLAQLLTLNSSAGLNQLTVIHSESCVLSLLSLHSGHVLPKVSLSSDAQKATNESMLHSGCATLMSFCSGGCIQIRVSPCTIALILCYLDWTPEDCHSYIGHALEEVSCKK